MPFEIPDNWTWTRASSLGYMVRGKGIKRTETVEKGLPCVRYGEIYTSYNESFSKAKSFIPEDLDQACSHFFQGDIIFTLTGENKVDIAKAVAYCGDSPVAAGGDMAYWTAHGMDPMYLVFFMACPYCIEQKRKSATGDIIVHISTSKIGSFLVPVPPIEEQHRIVKRISEITPSLEEYNEKEKQIQELTNLFPEQLKKSILQWAVQGKLVPQDPNDEPASALLERIREEKAQLVKEGKIKKDKNESVIFRRDNSHYEKQGSNIECIDEEIPFEIPDSWVWVRLGSILREIIVPMRDKPPFSGGIPWCRIEDRDGYFLNGTKSNQYVSEETIKRMNLKVNPIGTVLSASSGASIGTIVINTIECCTNQTFNGLVCTSGLHNWYLFWFLNSIIASLKKLGTGTTLAYISQEKYRRMLIPLPPLNEQYRIANRISELEQTLQQLK